jgi:hypothetical protein
MREERLVSAYEILDLFSELLLQRLSLLDKAKELPAELREAVATVLYCSARCAQELPELATLRAQFASKYGAPLVAAACGDATAASAAVNERVVQLLSLVPPPPALKLARLGEIAAEHNVAFDAAAASSSILGAAPDLVDVDTAGAWTEQSGPHMSRPLDSPGVTAVIDGWFTVGEPAAAAVAPPAAAPVAASRATWSGLAPPANADAPPPPLTPLPPAVPPAAGADAASEGDEYADAAAAARAAARSAEKAVHAAAAAARLARASPQETPAPAAVSPVADAAAAAAEEGGGDTDEDERIAASLPSAPTSAAGTPVQPPPAEAADAGCGDEAAAGWVGAQAAAASELGTAQPEVDEMTELTRRFEALKRRM